MERNPLHTTDFLSIEEVSDTEVQSPIPPFEDRLIENVNYYNSRSRKRQGEKFQRRFSKRQRTSDGLDDLFKNFSSLESAKISAHNDQKWLMINMEFSLKTKMLYDILHSDENDELKNLISENFVLWDVFQHSPAGMQYKNFYGRVTRFPYIAILDAATGEKLAEYDGLKSSDLNEFLKHFLSEHSSPKEESAGITQKDETISEISTENTESKPANLSTESFNHLTNEDKTRHKFKFLIQFPDGVRHITSWPFNTKLQILYSYIEDHGFKVEDFEIIALYPRRCLAPSDSRKTFEQANLFCREVLYLQEKTITDTPINSKENC
ncbi:hypothetical protein JTE90_013237 [Oedothorax gibbosus]|uniref:UBX domain-containing protein n=1 Tax=Oedothorax gibbosus TaxID=931172 RepID=A0AAV6VEY8_9ARAC|nr:hypothetical protein JTE90_013237 [Oedothorax gibbosus]